MLLLACTAATLDTQEPDDTAGSWEPPVVVVNEFMADNESTWVLEDGRSPDWVELYNPGKAVILDGWGLSDDPEEPHRQRLYGSLGTGSYRLVELEFGLSADGEQIGLYAAGGGALDVVVFGPQVADVAAARSPDGGETWTYIAGGSPGASNE